MASILVALYFGQFAETIFMQHVDLMYPPKVVHHFSCMHNIDHTVSSHMEIKHYDRIGSNINHIFKL